MGGNTIGKLMKNMAKLADIDITDRNINNHSRLKTMIQTLINQNVLPTMITWPALIITAA